MFVHTHTISSGCLLYRNSYHNKDISRVTHTHSDPSDFLLKINYSVLKDHHTYPYILSQILAIFFIY